MVAPPQVAMTLQGAEDFYTQPQKSVTIRHATDDRIIAIVEIAESALCIEAILKHFAEDLPRICDAGR